MANNTSKNPTGPSEVGIYGQAATLFGFIGPNYGPDGVYGLSVYAGVQTSAGIAAFAQYGGVLSFDFDVSQWNINPFSENFNFPAIDFVPTPDFGLGVASPFGTPVFGAGAYNSPLTGNVTATFGMGWTDIFELGVSATGPGGLKYDRLSKTWSAPASRSPSPTFPGKIRDDMYTPQSVGGGAVRELEMLPPVYFDINSLRGRRDLRGLQIAGRDGERGGGDPTGGRGGEYGGGNNGPSGNGGGVGNPGNGGGPGPQSNTGGQRNPGSQANPGGQRNSDGLNPSSRDGIATQGSPRPQTH